MRKYRFASIVGISALALLIFSTTAAHAQVFEIDPTQIVTNMTQNGTFIQTGKDWARNLLGSLLIIELFFIGIQQGLFKTDVSELIGSVAFRVATACIMLWLISNADTFFFGIVSGFQSAGQQLGGTSNASVFTVIGGYALAVVGLAALVGGLEEEDYDLSIPLGILVLGSGDVGVAAAQANQHGSMEILLQFLELILVMAGACILLQYFLLTIESYLIILGGIVFLGFSGSKFTMPFAQGYMSYSINVGAKLFAFYLVLAVEQNFLVNLFKEAAVAAVATLAATSVGIGASGPLMATMILVVFQAAILAALAWYVPNLAGSFLSGSSSISASSMLGNISGAMSAVAMSRAASAQGHASAAGNAGGNERANALHASGGGGGGGATGGYGSVGGKSDDTSGSATPAAISAVSPGAGVDTPEAPTAGNGTGGNPNSKAFTSIAGGAIKAGGGSAAPPAGAPLTSGGGGAPVVGAGGGGGGEVGVDASSSTPISSGSLAGQPIGTPPLATPVGTSGGGGGGAAGLESYSQEQLGRMTGSQAVAAFENSDSQAIANAMPNMSSAGRHAIEQHVAAQQASSVAGQEMAAGYAASAFRGAVPTGEAPPSAVQIRLDR